MSRTVGQRRYEIFDLDMETNTAFPSKLFQMLENSNRDVIGWLDNGMSFAIYDQMRFADLLPHYFKHKKMSSFQRQLNLYGFRRDKQHSSYFHPKFQRGRRDLIASIRRVPNKGTQKPEGGLYTGIVSGESDYFPPRINLRTRSDEGTGEMANSSGRSLRKLPNTWMNVHHHVTGVQGANVKRDEEKAEAEEADQTTAARTLSNDNDNSSKSEKEPVDESYEHIEKKAKIEVDAFSFARISDGIYQSIKNPIKRIPVVSDSECSASSNFIHSTEESARIVTKKSSVTANIGYYKMLNSSLHSSDDNGNVVIDTDVTDELTPLTGSILIEPILLTDKDGKAGET